jgi:hypothetical protein
MQRILVVVTGIAALASLSFACSKSDEPLSPTVPSTNGAPADGSTLKASPPAPQSPVNDQRLQTTDRPMLVAGAAKATFGDVPLQYRFQLLTSTGALVSESPLLSASNWLVNRDLDFNTKYIWRVRAEYQGNVSPWSVPASFFSPEGGFFRGQQVFDPLLNSTSVGSVGGGTFIPGQGWRANNVNDYINYDIPTLTSGTLEFDIVGVQSDEPGPYDIGMKFYSMGDGSQWDFIGFRNQPWKVSLDKKSGRLFPNESGVVENIFRLFDDDNRTKTGRNSFHEDEKYHVRLTWGRGHVLVMIGNEVIADENYSGEYSPPNHRIALGCSSRGETLRNAIWSQVKIGPQ